MSNLIKKEKAIYFENLDALRTIAAVLVFIAHGFRGFFKYLDVSSPLGVRLVGWLDDGGIGVSLFFVLSGFLITYLLISEYKLNEQVSLRSFYIRRVLRIWPLFFLVVLLAYFIFPLIDSVDKDKPYLFASQLKYTLFFLTNFDVMHTAQLTGGTGILSQSVTWSVSVEEQFYAVWPLIFVFLPKRKWLAAMVIILVGTVTFRLINRNDSSILYFHTLSVLPDLCIGGIMAYLTIWSDRVRFFFEKASTRTHLVFFTVTVLLILFRNDFPSQFGIRTAIVRVVIATAFSFIICAQALTKSDSILNLHKFKYADRLGKYTYGIYLLHPIAIKICNMFLSKLMATELTSFLFGILALALTILISISSYKLYESRFLKLKRKFEIIKSH